MGRIRTLVGEAVTPPTPMERQLDRLGQGLVGVSLACCGAALGLGLLRGVPLAEMAAAAIALAVAAVPEGLPAVATTTLALGTQRMARRGALIRRLAAVEGLGAATVICVDKTGTITANRMTVRGWQLGTGDFVPLPPRSRPSDSPPGPVLSDPRLERAVTIGVLCNEAELVRNGRRRGWSIDGSGTEGALLAAGHGAGLDYRALRARYPVLELRPRAEGENWMATVHAVGDDRRLVAVKGAPEEVLGRAVVRLDAAGPAPLDAEARRAILEANARMANDGMRVLGLAYREVDGGAAPGYDDLVWVGLVGLADPIRPGVREAIAACRRAGIRIVMLTGDQALTALTVARELGLVRDGQLRVAEAGQLEAADAEGLRRMAREVDVYARVTPAHKYRIVRALQAEGEVVAMTGDGINDGPALRAADVGIAMGARGTQLARDVADVVLLDDDFGSIVAAIEQGRTIAANAGKALRFLVATNFSEILVTLGALSIGIARPLSPVQLLWLNLLSDVFPALALAVEPAGPDVMERPPRPPTEPILPPGEMVSLAGDSAVMAAAALGARGLAAAAGAGGAAPSVLFTTLTGGQLLYALTCRSRSRPALPGLRRNPALAAAVGGSLALQVGTSVVPALRRLLGTAPIGAAGWSIALGGALLPFITREIVKAATRSSARPT
jgi:Ca2+-transporting ATPase